MTRSGFTCCIHQTPSFIGSKECEQFLFKVGIFYTCVIFLFIPQRAIYIDDLSTGSCIVGTGQSRSSAWGRELEILMGNLHFDSCYPHNIHESVIYCLIVGVIAPATALNFFLYKPKYESRKVNNFLTNNGAKSCLLSLITAVSINLEGE